MPSRGEEQTDNYGLAGKKQSIKSNRNAERVSEETRNLAKLIFGQSRESGGGVDFRVPLRELQTPPFSRPKLSVGSDFPNLNQFSELSENLSFLLGAPLFCFRSGGKRHREPTLVVSRRFISAEVKLSGGAVVHTFPVDEELEAMRPVIICPTTSLPGNRLSEQLLAIKAVTSA